MSNPTALLTDAVNLSTQLQAKLAALQAALAPTPMPRGNVPKEADGRLAPDGIDALYADFAAGKLTNRQLADRHEITLSGVLKRKSMWRKGRR